MRQGNLLRAVNVIKGTVLNIERFALHDGPGIRTAIFLKGCCLRCLWCSTPDSQNSFPEMQYFAAKCIKSKKCVEVCPVKAITVSNSGEILTDRRICDNYSKCVKVCPSGARTMAGEEMTVSQVLAEIEKDTVFYQNSGGGVTLSGGDPVVQPEFSLAILKACKERGIHTAIETCGYVKWDILDEMLKYLDLVYVDIKHMSPVEHEKLTGKRNKLILENTERIARQHTDIPLIIRVPVIPGYNDSDENIASAVKFVRRLKEVQRIELLPYHKLGVSKYTALIRDYPLADLEPPDEAHIHHLEEIVKSYGIQVQIGG